MTKRTEEEILDIAQKYATSHLISKYNEEYGKEFEKMKKQLELINDFIN